MPAENNDTAAAAAPTLTLPPFTSTDASPWFHRVEALFRLRAITSPSRKADYVIGALPTEIFSQISNWLINQGQDAILYDDLKAKIINRCSPTPEERSKKLMDLLRLPLGDQRPSTAFQEMRALATIPHPNGQPTSLDLLRVLWLLRLPHGIRSLITGFTAMSEDDLLKQADSLHGASTLASTSNTAAVADPPQPPEQDEEDPHTMAAQRPQQRTTKGPQRYPAEGPRRYSCYYHKKFGRDARQCRPPCSWSKNL